MRLALVAGWLGIVALAAGQPITDRPALPRGAVDFVPKQLPGHTLHARQSFHGRIPEKWEAMDVWVPDATGAEPLPCLVVLYGGGYGERAGGMGTIIPYAGRGYVLACPDYVLGARDPVPLCAWDATDAVRFLRANAKKYRIDPERIGVTGYSAGGWIAQDLFFAGPARIVPNDGSAAKPDKSAPVWVPMIPPHPHVHPEQSYRVQAVISDWGAGKLWVNGSKDRLAAAARWLTPDDPPLLTIYNGEKPVGEEPANPVVALQALGVPARGVYGHVGNTHVPSFASAVVDEAGNKTTWGEAHYKFLDDHVKNPTVATAPEVRPHGGFIREAAAIELLTVHPTGTIHYTLDGSEPTARSPRYAKPITVQPGQTVKAVVVREGLKPSRVATAVFKKTDLVQPRITTAERVFRVKAGEPLRVAFSAEGADGATWGAAGKVGVRTGGGNSPFDVWAVMDSKTGVLTGTPKYPGVYPVIVSCWRTAGGTPRDPTEWVTDARMISVVVE